MRLESVHRLEKVREEIIAIVPPEKTGNLVAGCHLCFNEIEEGVVHVKKKRGHTSWGKNHTCKNMCSAGS
jgi:hypothetical protein